jgi:hypothetical protein
MNNFLAYPTLMLEVPFGGEDHSDAVFVCGGDYLVVLF